MQKLLALILLLMVLCSFTSCTGEIPKQPTFIIISPIVYAPSPETTPVINEWVSFTTGNYAKYSEDPQVQPPASGKIFIGDSWSVEGQDSSSGSTGIANLSFSYGTYNSCKDIPQGKDLNVRYEMYDAQGNILQTEAITLSIDSCY